MSSSMSAPSIPNLLSLRGGRGGRGGRGRGAGRQNHHSHDAVVQDTDNDATVSRLSAVDAGYLHDPFAHPFVRQPQRRMPIINRGTYARTAALDVIVDRFLASSSSSSCSSSSSFSPSPEKGNKARPTHQIISLGAGSDTRSMRLFSSPGRSGILYHEIDFPAVCRRKLDVVAAAPELSAVVRPDESSVLPHMPTDTTVLHDAPGCSWASFRTGNACQLLCHGIDLRALAAAAPPPPTSESSTTHPSTTDPDALPSSPMPPPPPPQPRPQPPTATPSSSLPSPPIAIQHLTDTLLPDLPTLLLSECCLCYLAPADADAVVRFFRARVPLRLAVALYEPTRPDDAFGRVMASNLAARGLRMPTLAAYPHPSDQEARLRAAGFDGGGGVASEGGDGHENGYEDGGARCVTVTHVWDRWVPSEEKERLDALEGLDEVEEWTLLAGHYVVAWGWRGQGFEALAGHGPTGRPFSTVELQDQKTLLLYKLAKEST